jgi:hypothetical protein
VLIHFILLLASTTGCSETPEPQPIQSTNYLACHASAHGTAQHLRLHQHCHADAHGTSPGFAIDGLHGKRCQGKGLESIA